MNRVARKQETDLLFLLLWVLQTPPPCLHWEQSCPTCCRRGGEGGRGEGGGGREEEGGRRGEMAQYCAHTHTHTHTHNSPSPCSPAHSHPLPLHTIPLRHSQSGTSCEHTTHPMCYHCITHCTLHRPPMTLTPHQPQEYSLN